MLSISEYWNCPLDSLRGIDKSLLKKFEKLSLYTTGDLLLHIPRQYENRSQITPISQVELGVKLLCQGVVQSSKLIGRRRNILQISLKEKSSILVIRFFRYNIYLAKKLIFGEEIRVFGEIRFNQGNFEMVHPEIQFINQDKDLPDYLIAIYPSVEGLSQYRIRTAINRLLDRMINSDLHRQITNFDQVLQQLNPQLDLSFNPSHNAMTFLQALVDIHRPPLDSLIDDLENRATPSFHRVALEELCANRLSMLKLQDSFKTVKAPKINYGKDDTQNANIVKLYESLPFKLTAAQHQCIDEIGEAMNSHKPMMQLLQGDVGSGKTLVVLVALLRVISQGFKGVLMAPTELLINQHFNTFLALCEPLNVEIIKLSATIKTRERKKIQEKLLADKPLIVVGTHSLFQEKISIQHLALIVIDEQHRFGVRQRLNLLQKSWNDAEYNSHQILVSATPIPRTLAMTMYGDIGQSTINELPPNRQAIETKVISNENISSLIKAVGKQCERGRQIYWVCLFIDESEFMDVQSANNRFTELKNQLPKLNIGLLHGKIKEAEKTAIMTDFIEQKIQLLVATTIIEVGVDVPNASVMVIENAERLGLAQLHQLRGRVGRGSEKSQCLLLYQKPISENSQKRLNALRNNTDGFYLADLDLQMRGSGEIIGTKQSGDMSFKVVKIQQHRNLFKTANHISVLLRQTMPEEADCLINKWNFQESELGKV